MTNAWYIIHYINQIILSSSTFLNYILRIANFSMYLSAILVSLSITFSSNGLTYVGFFIAHVIWVWTALLRNDRPLVELMGFMIPMDVWAIGVRLLH